MSSKSFEDRLEKKNDKLKSQDHYSTQRINKYERDVKSCLENSMIIHPIWRTSLKSKGNFKSQQGELHYPDIQRIFNVK